MKPIKNVMSAFSSLIILIIINQVDLASGVGSKTYETSNGFPVNFLSDILNSDVVKKKTTSRWKWEVWDVVPGTHAYQIYLFNLTNPDEVERGGGKPKLEQVGPYYYREYRYKFDVSVNLDMTVNFRRNYSYTFDPSHSNGSESDTVNLINLPLIIFSTVASKHAKSMVEVNQAVNDLVASGETLVKRGVKVSDILFHGVDVSKYKKYLALMGPPTELTQEFQEGLYAVLKLKNGVHEGLFTVDSGLKQEKNVGKIVTYNGLSQLTFWNGTGSPGSGNEFCNKIEGSDGSVFPPHLQPTDKLKMFEVDFCRSISFEYEQDFQFKNVLGQTFKISGNVLEDPEVDKENLCFCTGPESSSCLKRGVLDVSNCRDGAPLVMSYAHLLDASPEYQQAVVGLRPDTKRHQTQVTVEPVTGAVITFHKRFQWNIWINKPGATGVDYLRKFPSVIVPILWNDDVFTLDPDKEELLMEELASQGGGGGTGALVGTSGAGNVFSNLFITSIILMVMHILK